MDDRISRMSDSSINKFDRPVSVAYSNNRRDINQGGTRPTGGTGLTRSNKMKNNIFDLSSNALNDEKEFSKKALNIDNLLNEDINLAYGAGSNTPYKGVSRAGSRQSQFRDTSNNGRFDNQIRQFGNSMALK